MTRSVETLGQFLTQEIKMKTAINGDNSGPNDDDRSDDQRQADNDNHANQCNPNNDEYWNSRGEGDD